MFADRVKDFQGFIRPRGQIRRNFGYTIPSNRFNGYQAKIAGDNRFNEMVFDGIIPNKGHLYYDTEVMQGSGVRLAGTGLRLAGTGINSDLKQNVKEATYNALYGTGIIQKSKDIIGKKLFTNYSPSYPGEQHLPGYNFCGPKTHLEERLARGDKPVNKLDSICKTHDIAYSNAKTKQDIRKADKEFIKTVDNLKEKSISGVLAKTAIKTKVLGENIGILKPNTFTNVNIGNGIQTEKKKKKPATKLKKKLIKKYGVQFV